MTWNWLLQTAVAGLIILILTSLYNRTGAVLMSRRPALVRGAITFGLIWVAGFLGVSTLAALDWMRRPHVTTGNVESKVLGWAKTFNLATKAVNGQEAKDCFFMLELSRSKERPIYVQRRKECPQYLRLWTKIHPQFLLEQKPTDAQLSRIAQELRVELSKSKMACDVPDSLEPIMLERLIPIGDDLTEDAFHKQFQEVDFAMVVIAGTMVLRLDQMIKEENSGTDSTPFT